MPRCLLFFYYFCKPEDRVGRMRFFSLETRFSATDAFVGSFCCLTLFCKKNWIQREASQNLFRFSTLTDEWNNLKGERKAARAKANEASSYRIDDGPADCSQLVSTLRDSGKFTDDALETLQTQFLEFQKITEDAHCQTDRGWNKDRG